MNINLITSIEVDGEIKYSGYIEIIKDEKQSILFKSFPITRAAIRRLGEELAGSSIRALLKNYSQFFEPLDYYQCNICDKIHSNKKNALACCPGKSITKIYACGKCGKGYTDSDSARLCTH